MAPVTLNIRTHTRTQKRSRQNRHETNRLLARITSNDLWQRHDGAVDGALDGQAKEIVEEHLNGVGGALLDRRIDLSVAADDRVMIDMHTQLKFRKYNNTYAIECGSNSCVLYTVKFPASS